jgi:hypothetical protein
MTARIFNLQEDERFVRATGFSGAISLPLLPDIIQIYTVSMADGALTIRRGTQSGTIWFERGAMVHAVCGALTGEEAVYRLLEWGDGQFSLDKTAAAPLHSIEASWQEVLMEGCRRLDEAAMGEVKDATPALSGAAPAPQPFAAAFSHIEQSLTGLLAVAVLDVADGTVIAQRVRTAALDFRTAGPLIAELLRQQARVMASLGRPAALLDSFSTLDDQVHLLDSLPEGRLLYLAVARDGVNLAVVRRVVDRALGRS